MSHPLVLPMLLQMVLALITLLILAPRRVSAVKNAGGVKGLIAAGGFSRSLVNHGDNFKNQFELPVIFYALCLVFMTAGSATQLVVISAWVFVASRIIHTLIQTTNNKIFPNRFAAFLIGALALIVMTVAAFIQALAAQGAS